MDARCILAFVLLLCVNCSPMLSLKIPEVTRDNFQQMLKEKKCMILYATEDNCEKCDLLYNKFVTVSQTFMNDPDIAFARFSDKALVDVFELKTFPSIVFYEYGSAVPKTYTGDITTIALTKVVAKAAREDFKSLDVKHAAQLTKANFDDIIGNGNQYRLVMLHEHDDEDEIATFDELAEIFDNDLEIVVSRINVDEEKNLDYKYISDVYPSFYWYEKGNVDKKKRYGGQLKIDQMVAFINQQTGTLRMKDGRLSPFAGLIKSLDDVIDKHGENVYKVQNIDAIKKDVKSAIKKLPKGADKELANYYLHLLEELEEDGTIETLEESRSRLYRYMEEAGPLEKDQLFRKRNIIQKFIDTIGRHILAEFSDGDIDLTQDFQDYIAKADSSNHGIEFHEEF